MRIHVLVKTVLPLGQAPDVMVLIEQIYVFHHKIMAGQNAMVHTQVIILLLSLQQNIKIQNVLTLGFG